MLSFFLPDLELSYLFPIGCLGDIINLCNCFDVPRQSRVREVGIAVDSVNTIPVTPVLRKVAFEVKKQQVALALLIPVER